MKKIIKTSLLLLWLFLIYYLSSQTGSVSGGLSEKILREIAIFINQFIKIDIDSFVKSSHFLFRKGAHFMEYFILYILSIECFKEYKDKPSAIYTLLFVILYACFDEFHQLFVGGRAGQIRDVLIDSSGAIFSSLIWHKLFKK
ncbi:MAG: VanZ family protein [Erysipelotrichaceae bacterium]|nr:VanZ family protein [Erysipelotrichaceae bacterium]